MMPYRVVETGEGDPVVGDWLVGLDVHIPPLSNVNH